MEVEPDGLEKAKPVVEVEPNGFEMAEPVVKSDG